MKSHPAANKRKSEHIETQTKGAQPPWTVWHRTSGICHTREHHKQARANGTRWGDISFAGAGITAPSLRLCAEAGCATKQTQCAPQLAHVVHYPSNVLCRRSCKGARKRNQKERSRHGSYGTGQAVFVTQENSISGRGQMVHDGGISPLPAPVSQLHRFAYVLKQDVRRSKRSVRRNMHTSYTIHPMPS